MQLNQRPSQFCDSLRKVCITGVTRDHHIPLFEDRVKNRFMDEATFTNIPAFPKLPRTGTPPDDQAFRDGKEKNKKGHLMGTTERSRPWRVLGTRGLPTGRCLSVTVTNIFSWSSPSSRIACHTPILPLALRSLCGSHAQ